MDTIELRKQLSKDLRSGNYDNYVTHLHQIWNRDSTVKKTVKEVIKPKKIVVKKEITFEDIDKTKGFGRKTMKDIRRQADTILELKALLIAKKLAVRDDIEIKLRNILDIN